MVAFLTEHGLFFVPKVQTGIILHPCSLKRDGVTEDRLLFRQGSMTFSGKSQRINISGFVGRMVSCSYSAYSAGSAKAVSVAEFQ